MNATVQKWGNSLALRIPSSLAKDVHLHRGTVVEVTIVQGQMIVKPKREKKYSLSRMLRGIKKRNLHSEHFGEARMGRESL